MQTAHQSQMFKLKQEEEKSNVKRNKRIIKVLRQSHVTNHTQELKYIIQHQKPFNPDFNEFFIEIDEEEDDLTWWDEVECINPLPNSIQVHRICHPYGTPQMTLIHDLEFKPKIRYFGVETIPLTWINKTLSYIQKIQLIIDELLRKTTDTFLEHVLKTIKLRNHQVLLREFKIHWRLLT